MVVTKDINAKPIAIDNPVTMLNILGPILSFSFPAKMPKKPDMIVNIENTPEVAAVVEENS